MAVEDTSPPPPPSSSTDKIISFSIPNKDPIKLDFEKHNYNAWSSFSPIHLGNLELKAHVESETANLFHDNKDARAINLDNELRSIKIEKLTVNKYCTKIRSMTDRLKNLGGDVSDKNLVLYPINGLDSRFATLVEIIRHRETFPSFATTRNMLLLKESSFNESTDASTTFDSSYLSPTILMASTSSDTKGNTDTPSKSVNNLQLCNHFSRGTWIFLSQKKYALELLARAHMVNCNPSRTPVDSEAKLGPDGVPVEPYFTALKHILHYVQGTLELGLHLYDSVTTSLVSYTDADWAGCPSTRRSTSGYCVFLGDNLLSWSTKRQHTLFRSSAEAEYRGVANVVAETAWLRNLLCELHSPLLTAPLVYYDNVSTVYMSANPYADIFTKSLLSALFKDFRSSLSVRPPPAQTARAY
nr:hypothetical protein [Tanacetum cinerariifolium]